MRKVSRKEQLEYMIWYLSEQIRRYEAELDGVKEEYKRELKKGENNGNI